MKCPATCMWSCISYFCIILLMLVLVLLDNQGVLLVISCVLLFYCVPRLPRQHSGDKSIIVCFTKSLYYELLVLH